MVLIFNLLGLGMLALSVGLWFLLATVAPKIGGTAILAAALAALFVLDAVYRVSVVRAKVEALKAQTSRGEVKPVRTDLIAVLPTPIGAAISGKGGMLMLLPCWLFSVLLACFFFLLPLSK